MAKRRVKPFAVITRAALNDILNVTSILDNRVQSIECYTPITLDEIGTIKKHQYQMGHR